MAETPRPKVPAKSTQELWKAVSGESPRRCSRCGCLEAAFQNVAVEPAAPDLLYGRSSVVSPSRGLSTRMLPVDQSHFLSLLSTQPCGEEEEEGEEGGRKVETHILSLRSLSCGDDDDDSFNFHFFSRVFCKHDFIEVFYPRISQLQHN